MNRNIKAISAAAVLAGIFALPANAFWLGGPSCDSHRTVKPMTIDGSDKDWTDADEAESSGFAFSFAHDGQNLYLRMTPTTQEGKTLLASAYDQNFVIWIDTGAHKAKHTGIKLIPARQKGKRGDTSLSNSENDAARDFSGDEEMPQPPDMDSSQTRMPPPDEENDGSGGDSRPRPGKDRNRVSTGTIKLVGFDQDLVDALKDDVLVKIGTVSKGGALEARIPVSILGGTLPNKITVGFEASSVKSRRGGPGGMRGGGQGGSSSGGQMDGESRGGGRRGGPPPGGRPPMDGNGGRGGPPQGMGQESGQDGGNNSQSENEPLKVWVKVTLAK